MATTHRIYQDFISFVTDADPGASGTSLSAPGLADLAIVNPDDYISLTLDPEKVFGDPEIVWVSAHSSSATTATIVRGQETTANRAHPIGTKVVLAATRETTVHAARHAAGGADEIVAALVIGDTAQTTPARTITETFVDDASLAFTMPNDWVTALIVAQGLTFYEVTSQADEFETRVEIGASNGPTLSFDTISSGVNLPAVHRSTVSGNSTIAIASRKTGPTGVYSVEISTLYYIAIRTA